ncbi:MAG: acyl-CoA/acyl-ACP dehydrogenase [Acidimicrobiales bacterium]|nr:acyl-CoA/acyl-ACP dehydrogenase [Acidimicrobiales bacterium]
MLDLDFTEEQDMLREAVGGLCDDKAPLESVRALENDETGFDAEFWQQLAMLGVTGALIPEEHGGSGMSLMDAVVVYEEFGRSLAPSPHLVSAVVCAGVLTRAGSDAQQAEWLPKIASGEAIVSAAWLEPDNSSGPAGVQMVAEAAGEGWSLSGAKRHVFFAKAASAFVVLARSADGVDLFLVPADADGISLTQQNSVAYDTQYRVDFDNVAVGADQRIGPAGSGWGTWHRTLLEAGILVGAQCVGGAKRVHEITSEYAQERVQFDKPLAAFQSISHYLADGITEIDGARVLVYQAAWARDAQHSIEKLAPMAKMIATETFRKVSATAIQVHGGMGFTVECDAQLYFRRAKSLELNWFDTSHLEELIAAQVLD